MIGILSQTLVVCWPSTCFLIAANFGEMEEWGRGVINAELVF